MKKYTFGIYLSFALAAVLLGCSSQTTEENVPEVANTTSGITISVKPDSGTKYINVYRQNMTVANSPVVSLGELLPDDEFPSTVLFIDRFALNGIKYRYRIRFYALEKYSYTDWTGSITSACTLTDAPNYTSAAGAKMTFAEDGYTLTLSGTVTEPTLTLLTGETLTPKVALQTVPADTSVKTESSVFTLKAITDGTVFDGNKMLPYSFRNVPLKVLGLVAEISFAPTASGKYTEYYWSEPLSASLVKMVESVETPITTFTVVFSADPTDIDYSSPSESINSIPADF